MSAPTTLRARLAVAVAVAVLAAVALFAIVTVLLVRHELRGSLDGALRQRAQQVAQLAVLTPAVLSTPGALESPASERQLAVEVIDARGRILARSVTLGARLLPQDRLARAALHSGRTGFEDVRISARQFRLYAAPIADATGPAAGGAVLVASDTTDIASTISHLGLVISLIGAAVCVLAALAAAILTRRGLGPLQRLAGAAGEIERTADPSRRLPDPEPRRGRPADDEIGALTGVLNRMLAALEQSRAGERRFLADASHELRTPVTTLLGNVEFAARHGTDDEVLGELRRDAERLARLVDDLLALERVGASEPEFVAVPIADLARELAREHDDRVTVAAPPVGLAVRGDPESLRRLLENLIENALVHGPEGGDVTITVATRGDSALVTVADQGPGPDPGERERLFERFWRGQAAAGRPGSGLGLAIVAAIADRHGGSISVEGARFTVALPRV